MVKLSEGSEYEFYVEKETISPEGRNHYVLTGPDNKKYLIPVRYYSYYKIKPGRTIICRIDRINCMGRIFLEPRNPLYAEGKKYSFFIIGDKTVTDRKGRSTRVIYVSDRQRNIIEVYPGTGNFFPEEGTTVEIRIERISKGRIYLTKKP
jgi:hypothetical protein